MSVSCCSIPFPWGERSKNAENCSVKFRIRCNRVKEKLGTLQWMINSVR